MDLTPVVLEGPRVRLLPLEAGHCDALCAVGLDPAIWRWTAGHVDSPAAMRAYVDKALARQAAGEALPFAIEEKASRTVVGCTRFGNIAPAHRRVEIGWTWFGVRWQGTGLNAEAKYLMLRHAFDGLGCVRVELKTDALNERSRRAIRGLGAVEEGVLRRHLVTSRGRVRDTVYYSIVDHEWPDVQRRLEARLGS